MLHSYVHQPRSDAMPGFTLGRYGTHFGRLVTWWIQAAPWISYLSRSQFLLQSGVPMSDVLVLRTEEDDCLRHVPVPALPAGYSFDWVAPAQLLAATPKDTALSLAGAQSYRVLLLPDLWTADVAMLQQITRIAEAGIPVFGGRPVAPTSVRDLQAQAEWQRLVSRLWDTPGTLAGVRTSQAFAEELKRSIQPDLTFTMADANTTPPTWTHRRMAEGDLYFLSNGSATRIAFTASFREQHREPELWNAVSGEHAVASTFRYTRDKATVPLELASGASVFILFRRPLPPRWLVSATLEPSPGVDRGLPAKELPAQPSSRALRLSSSGRYKLTWNDGSSQAADLVLPLPVEATGEWTVHLQPPAGAAFDHTFSQLHDLATDRDGTVKYFAGTMTYRKHVAFTQAQLAGNGCTLSLGTVHDIASVRINGHEAGTAWTFPFQVDVTQWLKPGENLLEIEVVNRWVNRLIGDEFLPADTDYRTDGTDFNRGRLAALPAWYGNPVLTAQRQRSTFASWKHYTRDSPLVPSGLIGPVSFTFYRELPLTAPDVGLNASGDAY